MWTENTSQISKFTFSTGILLEFFCIDPNKLNYHHWYNSGDNTEQFFKNIYIHLGPTEACRVTIRDKDKHSDKLYMHISPIFLMDYFLALSPELKSNSSFSILWSILSGALITSRFSLNISYALCSCWISYGYIIISSLSLII